MQWEYKVEEKASKDRNLVEFTESDYLYDIGYDGWELCGPPIITGDDVWVYYWKRVKQ